jgi:GT2 family glycosyltransferase
VAAYRSESTIARCLESLAAQTYPSFELIVVDSSPDDGTAAIVRSRFPQVVLVRSRERLLPHASRNRGVREARGRLLVFTDGDVYPRPTWLERLVTAHERSGGAVTGAIDCAGRSWAHRGMHYTKFDEWLPGGEFRSTEYAPTASFLCERRVFDEVGGFRGENILGDAIFSRRLRESGIPLWLEPAALVEHQHEGGLRSHLVERYERGRALGRLRLDWEGFRRPRAALQMAASVLPARLAKLLFRASRNAWRAGRFLDFLSVAPWVVAGQWFWLLGEAAAYAESLRRESPCESSS